MFKFHLVLVSSLGLSVLASAQSYGSFSDLTSLSGVNVTAANSLDYTVKLNSGATMVFDGTTYDVTQVFGFFQLSASNSLGTPTGNDINDWKFVTKSDNSGQIAGWDHNSNNGRLNAGDSQSFAYTTIKPSDQYGFHFTYTNTNGKGTSTGYFAAPQPAPEPCTMLALGAGIVGAIRVRRKNRSAA